MAWIATPWGYDVAEPLEPFVNEAEFYGLTSGKYATDERIPSTINGSCAAIRKHCGWHIAGSVECRATFDGGSSVLWLPANHVTEITSVKVLGEEVTGYQWSRQGELRIPRPPDVLSAVEVEYVAGYPVVPDDIVELVIKRVERRVTSTYGVTQETAGSVTVSYAPSAATDTGSSNLTREDRAALSGYRLVEAM